MNKYTPEEKQLANHLAETLKDREALPFYLSLTKKYKESHLRELLAKVMGIDAGKIRKTRGALFTWLVNQHGGHNSGAEL